MVNLRGGLRGLGVGLTYMGQQGMAEQQRQAEDRRLLDRAAALARLGQTISNENADIEVKRGIEREEAETPVLVEREAMSLKTREPFREREAERTEEMAVRRDERESRREETRDQRELRQEIARENRAAQREETQEARRLEREGDAVVDRFTNDQGFRVLVTRSGQEITLTNRVRESGGDDDWLDEEATTATPPPPARRPTLTPRPTGRQQQTRMVPVGSIVRDAQGRRYRMGPNGERIPLGR